MKKFRLFAREQNPPPEEPPAASSALANIGCGVVFHADWDNFDYHPHDVRVRRLDLGRPLPFAPSVYQACYLSHVLEHLPRERVPGLLAEIFRSLRPGGTLRLVVPDLETIVRLYLRELEAAASDPEAAPRHEWMTLELIDQLARSFSGGFMGRTMRSRPLPHRDFIEGRIGWEGRQWLQTLDGRAGDEGPALLSPADIYRVRPTDDAEEAAFRRSGEVHRWMYDRVSLRRILGECGYTDIAVCRADESRIPGFAGYCLDTDAAGNVRKADSLFMEASKPR